MDEKTAFRRENCLRARIIPVQSAPSIDRSSAPCPIRRKSFVAWVFRYLAGLENTKRILWCYLCWYLAIVFQYFDPAPGLWFSSLGIAGLIGFALNLAARQNGRSSDRWVVFRLYLFPFCVSSYSALIKGKGFFLLFPPDWKPLLVACAACFGFVVISCFCTWISRPREAVVRNAI